MFSPTTIDCLQSRADRGDHAVIVTIAQLKVV